MSSITLSLDHNDREAKDDNRTTSQRVNRKMFAEHQDAH